MLRQIYILKDGNIIYEMNFGKALTRESFQNIAQEILKEASRGLEKDFGSTYFFKHRIVYFYENETKLLFILIVGLNDGISQVKSELMKLKKEFINIFGDSLENIDSSLIELLNPLIFSIYKNIKTKISLVGFSGVGKTTITKLIRSEEIPDVHVPTITGKVSAIKIGKLHFHLWDFAGQEQFSYLWNDFIYGSDAVLVITDSSLENVEKSRFFIELIKENAPDAHAAVIGNKQDLPDALSVEKIEEILKIKTYSMIAIDPNNRNKMIQIIADILEINTEVSPLLKPLFERDLLISQAENYLKEGDMVSICETFEKLSDLCYELGDFILYKEFREKADKIKAHIENI